MRRIVILLAALLVAGCGATSGAKTPKQIFVNTCGTCHTLQDAGTGGGRGPNLDDLKPDEARVRAAIENGPGGMPDGLLKGPEADAVAVYVSNVSGG